MDNISKKKKKKICVHGLDSDIISNLPDNITDEILVRLPIREAVRTCVLSTKWRYKWTTIPELVFRDRSHEYTPQNEKDEIMNFIDGVLMRHTGQIQKFELLTSSVPSSLNDRCVFFLSSKNIKVFKLKFEYGEHYVVPSCLFSAQQLCTLELKWCVLDELPPTFTGFSTLKSLDLSQCTLGGGVLERLISKCPLLERLILELYDGIGHLKICAPNLKYSKLSGNFGDISFGNAPFLSVLAIYNLVKISDQQLELFRRSGTCPLVKLLSSIPNIRNLYAMFQETTEFLGACNIPDRLPFTCHYLSSLSLSVDFEYLNQVLVIFCLFNSSHSLQELNIEVWSKRYSCLTSEGCTAVYDLNEIQERMGCNMDQLQVVKMTSAAKWKLNLELNFITLVLANTPMLKMLSFETSNMVQFSLRQICNLPRASPNAEVKYLTL